MIYDVTIPAAGESISSAAISRWYKKNGDWVSEGELLVSLETDKVSNDLLAEHEGSLTILAEEGEEVTIGSVIARLNDEALSSSVASVSSPGTGGSTPPKEEGTERVKTASSDAGAEVSRERLQESLPSLGGESLVKGPSRSIVYGMSADGRTERRKMSPLRRKIASRLVEARNQAAILTTFNECDMTSLVELRKATGKEFQERYGVKLGFMSFFIKSVVSALREVPALNALIEGDDIVQNHYYDIGVAVGTERGLVVPVLRDCERKSIAVIEGELADLADRARKGTLGMDELMGGVFTLSNGGVYGSLLSTPIVNPPQSGVLGLHAIKDRPVALDGQVVIRPMMYLALSYDHRLVDGRESVRFLAHVKDCIETPARLMLEE